MAIEPAATYRAVLASHAQAMGLDFAGVADLPEALAFLDAQPAELITIAAHLPSGEFPEILGTLRSHPAARDVPVLLVTADADEGKRRAALEMGITEVFGKDDLVHLHAYLGVVASHARGRAAGRSGRVLLVEDSASSAAMIRAALSAEGFDATVAPSVRAALDCLADRRFRLAVVDLVLEGGQSGVILIQKIRAMKGETGRLPIIAVSAFADGPRRRLAAQSGADAFLPKPLDPGELAHHVRRLALRLPAAGAGAPVRRSPVPAAPGGVSLTPRESRVAELVLAGCSDKEIARRLGISYWTVRTHVASVLRKRQVANRLELVRQALGGKPGSADP
ncbi:MAG: response regulator [Rhodocyclaceae bacterium]|nr:response regulator [Rhodocyclaceae bacterium]